jgi:hypothetical protein
MSGQRLFEPAPRAFLHGRLLLAVRRAWLGVMLFPLLALALDERDERVPSAESAVRPSPLIERTPAAPGSARSGEGAGQTPPIAAGDGPRRFVAAAGERLSAALSRFVAGYGWDLEWDAGPDFVIQRAYAVELDGADLRSAIARVLTPYRLSAVMHNSPPQRVVSVMAGSTAGHDGVPPEARP